MITHSDVYLGVMSGSSLDGLDIAMVTFLSDPKGNYVNYQIDNFITVPYPDGWIERLRNYDSTSVVDYMRMQSEYSYTVASMISTCIDAWSVPHTDIKAIGLHGQTLIHIPEEGLTVQLGNGGIVSAYTGIATVSDFRVQDIARKGKGAPIAPIVDTDVFVGYKGYLNLGGIANISFPFSGIAYDICPLNQVSNYYAMKLGVDYDDGGRLAQSGNIDMSTYEILAAQPYFLKSYPKTLDNNYIRHQYIPLLSHLDPADALATCTEVAASQIATCVGNHSPILVTGGGAYNTYLIERIRHNSGSNVQYIIPESQIIEAKESVLMAYMAFLRIQRKININKSYTGAHTDTIAGALYE